MSRDFITTRTLTLKKRRKIKTAGGFAFCEDRALFTATMEIDVDSIMERLATRAAASKSGKARYMHGRIVVTVKPKEQGQ